MNFNSRVDMILDHKAITKGYDGREGGLFQLCKQLPHPLGEIIYKVVRYHKQGNPDDLVKIAGWARLLWEERHADGTRSDTGNATGQAAARPIEQGPRKGRVDFGAGDVGGDTRGSGRNPFAEAVRAASIIGKLTTVGTGPGGRRRKFVGRKSRQRKVKG